MEIKELKTNKRNKEKKRKEKKRNITDCDECKLRLGDFRKLRNHKSVVSTCFHTLLSRDYD